VNSSFNPTQILTGPPGVIVHGTENTAPAAATVLADSLALTPGTYLVYAGVASTDTAANIIQVAHRNAANNADVELADSQSGVLAGGPQGELGLLGWFVISNSGERVVVRNKNAGTAALFYQADLYLWRY